MVESSRPATIADVARHYDQLDRFYRAIWGEHLHHGLWHTGRESSEEATRAMVDAVIARAQPSPGMKVLDVGCGYGATARILAAECRTAVTALTISPAQHRRATTPGAGADNPCCLLQDWLRNELPDSSFDVLIAIESTEHMTDKARAFSEAARVLLPGGRMVVCAWIAGDSLKPWHRRRLLEPICREGRMPAIGTESDYVQWMTRAGFAVISSDDVSRHVARTWPVCARRFLAALVRQPAYARFLFDRRHDNRVFALTMFRLWLAYRVKALRYVIFTAVKGSGLCHDPPRWIRGPQG
jgi:tocopherol O-methyltransferase